MNVNSRPIYTVEDVSFTDEPPMHRISFIANTETWGEIRKSTAWAQVEALLTGKVILEIPNTPQYNSLFVGGDHVVLNGQPICCVRSVDVKNAHRDGPAEVVLHLDVDRVDLYHDVTG